MEIWLGYVCFFVGYLSSLAFLAGSETTAPRFLPRLGVQSVMRIVGWRKFMCHGRASPGIHSDAIFVAFWTWVWLFRWFCKIARVRVSWVCSFLRALKVDPCLSLVAMFQRRSPTSTALSCNASLMYSWAERNNIESKGSSISPQFSQASVSDLWNLMRYCLYGPWPVHNWITPWSRSWSWISACLSSTDGRKL